MKKPAKLIALSVLGLILLLFIWVIGNTTQISSAENAPLFGWTNVIVQSEWQKVENRWNSGDFIGAVSKSFRASWITIDCSVRSLMSQPYFRQSVILENHGQFKQALDVCIMGARLMSQYDPEGAISYQCAALEMRHHILFPTNNLPTSTIEP